MIYTFFRVGAALKIRVEDLYIQGRRTGGRLREKGGRRHEILCNHNLEARLHGYLNRISASGGGKTVLFRSVRGRSGELIDHATSQSDAWRMIRRRGLAAGIRKQLCNHSFRATGITEFLNSGGKREITQQIANHENTRTAGRYGRRNDNISLDEIERIFI